VVTAFAPLPRLQGVVELLDRPGNSDAEVRGSLRDLERLNRSFGGVRTILLNDWQPRQFDVVVEATGSPSGLELALGAVRPRGTLVLKSTIAGNHDVSLAAIVINEITIIGSRCGLFAPALEALEEKSVSVTPLIEKIYPLNDGIEAVKHAARQGARKILLRP